MKSFTRCHVRLTSRQTCCTRWVLIRLNVCKYAQSYKPQLLCTSANIAEEPSELHPVHMSLSLARGITVPSTISLSPSLTFDAILHSDYNLLHLQDAHELWKDPTKTHLIMCWHEFPFRYWTFVLLHVPVAIGGAAQRRAQKVLHLEVPLLWPRQRLIGCETRHCRNMEERLEHFDRWATFSQLFA